MLKPFLSLLIAGTLAVSGTLNAKELLVDQNNKAKWSGKVEYAADKTRGKGPCFVLYGPYPTPLIYKEFIQVDPDKVYTFKANLRTLDAALPASGYMGFELYDAKKRKMGFYHVAHLGLEQSEVVSAKKGDMFMIVKMIKDYQKVRVFRVVFHAEKDFSDIPNFNLSPGCKKITPTKDGNLRIDFAAPLKKDYPAGTTLRLHTPYGAPMYYLADGWMPAGDGKECTAVIHGIMEKPGTPRNKFWKGTKYVRPFVWFGNWNRKPEKGAKLLVDGLSLTETDPVK